MVTGATVAVRLNPYRFDSSLDISKQPDRKHNFDAVRLLEDGIVFDGMRMKYRQGGNGTGSWTIIDGAGWKVSMNRIFGLSDQQKSRLHTYGKIAERAMVKKTASGETSPKTFEDQLLGARFRISHLKGGFSIGERTYSVEKLQDGRRAVRETTSAKKQFAMLFTQSREDFQAVENTVNTIKLALAAWGNAKREFKMLRNLSPASVQSRSGLVADEALVLYMSEPDDGDDDHMRVDQRIRIAAEEGMARISREPQETSSSRPAVRAARYPEDRSVPPTDAGMRENLLAKIADELAERHIADMALSEFAQWERLRSQVDS